MAPINSELLEKIARRLDVSTSHAYALIAEKARTTHLPRHLAAVALAADAGINVGKRAYATDEDRAQIRAASSPLAHHQATAPPTAVPATPRSTNRSTRRSQPRPRKSNAVMVVHGRNTVIRDAMYTFLRTL